MSKVGIVFSVLIAITIALLQQSVMASPMDDAYWAGVNIGKASAGNITELMRNVEPAQILPNDGPNIEASDFDLEDPEVLTSLTADAQRLSRKDPQLALLLNSTNGSREVIDPSDPLFASSLSIEAQAQTLIPSSGYCLNGDCVDPTYPANDEFDQVATALSAVGEGVDDFGMLSQIFQGQAMSCNKSILDFKDCCVEKGWGLDINLASCNKEEQQLGLAREQQRAIDVGRYCAESLLGVCYRTKRVFCVFKSKMAKIVQEQGRAQQLGINFSSAHNPECGGLTPGQLQQLDFEYIDLSMLYADVESQVQLPNQGGLQRQAIQDVNHAIQ